MPGREGTGVDLRRMNGTDEVFSENEDFWLKDKVQSHQVLTGQWGGNWLQLMREQGLEVISTIQWFDKETTACKWGEFNGHFEYNTFIKCLYENGKKWRGFNCVPVSSSLGLSVCQSSFLLRLFIVSLCIITSLDHRIKPCSNTWRSPHKNNGHLQLFFLFRLLVLNTSNHGAWINSTFCRGGSSLSVSNVWIESLRTESSSSSPHQQQHSGIFSSFDTRSTEAIPEERIVWYIWSRSFCTVQCTTVIVRVIVVLGDDNVAV